MRESQMKKIIALAVAGAFVAPAYATEVSIGGEMEYVITSSDAAEDKITDSDNLITITASDELDNGMSISATYVIMTDTGDSTVLENDGTSLTVSGSFGSVTVGDTAGALDATGDWTDIAPSGGSYAMDGGDHAITYKLPAFNGLQIIGSYSPDGANDMGAGDDIKAGAQGLSATYTLDNISVYYGSEEYPASTGAANDTYNSMGVKGSFGAIYVAYESGEKEPVTGAKTDYSGFAVSYKMGDLVIGGEIQETKQVGVAATTDATVMFAEYNMGSNVDLYVSLVDDGTATDDDSTRVGIEYNF